MCDKQTCKGCLAKLEQIRKLREELSNCERELLYATSGRSAWEHDYLQLRADLDKHVIANARLRNLLLREADNFTRHAKHFDESAPTFAQSLRDKATYYVETVNMSKP